MEGFQEMLGLLMVLSIPFCSALLMVWAGENPDNRVVRWLRDFLDIRRPTSVMLEHLDKHPMIPTKKEG